jgi:hypothetical protein
MALLPEQAGCGRRLDRDFTGIGRHDRLPGLATALERRANPASIAARDGQGAE